MSTWFLGKGRGNVSLMRKSREGNPSVTRYGKLERILPMLFTVGAALPVFLTAVLDRGS
ncbi:hypothetical protein [Rhodopirellula sallentina]|uniref:Uncharacterized protein n=1 Tax=Rhodopirellula sallentina SM41 TaxID=1263870 RepID=M5UAX6_9BACT|nr:hypothetical protein [Rhodopirellula sallentina]EMI58454.1 hypothetical protein RSSM_00129 [Rhodopirellula sallentina SM41]